MNVNVKLYQRANPRTALQTPKNISGLIDFYVTKNISSNYTQIEDNLELNSNHTPISLTLSESIIQKPCSPVLVSKKTDWEGFRMTIEERIQLSVPLQTEEKLDYEVEKFVKDIQQSAWEDTPESKEG